VDEGETIAYEAICELAGKDPTQTTSILYILGPVDVGEVHPGEVAPLRRYAFYNVEDKK
jgi:hypothetical protein